MSVATLTRVSVDGKFFRIGAKKFFVKGVSYGPFAPNAAGEPFASPEQTAQDFAQIRTLGANTIRVYHVPARWFLDMAQERGLKVLVDIPWNKNLCVLDSPKLRQEACNAVRNAVASCNGHPAVFAFSLVNELPPDIVRWSGTSVVADFIDELVAVAKMADPNCLCTFSNYPPTEFLRPKCVDFVCFNVYLHHSGAFKSYLARLQMVAEAKPLLLGEFGVDSIREGETRKQEMLVWQIEAAFRGGLAGSVVFSFTDDWFRGGQEVTDWALGLTDRVRNPKPSFSTVQQQYQQAPYFPLARYPKVSVVVASYNGDQTLRGCLESLSHLNYPDYEVILVDDGSTDTTPQIASAFPYVHYIRHQSNQGLSAARNTGIAASHGDIVAFTDGDCRADEDWLYYLVGELLNDSFVGMGGPNLMPAEDSPVSAVVMASPGGPAHVMLTDREAEHIPGCNMAFWKWALTGIGGFDPIFRAAGDDVDVCWRLQQAGHRIGFSPAALVWHYRRSNVGAYLKQQRGYGDAEALLIRKHPEYFNSFGASIWRGRIYTSSNYGIRVRDSIIYRGLFGSAGYQTLYASDTTPSFLLCTSLEYHILVTVPLWVLSALVHPLLPLAITSGLVSVGICVLAGLQAEIPKSKLHWWSRPLVALLFFLQPIVRGWARHRSRIGWKRPSAKPHQTLESVSLRDSGDPLDKLAYWANREVDRLAFVSDILRRLQLEGWPSRPDAGWSAFDVEIFGNRWVNLQLVTMSEHLRRNQQTIRCKLQPRWSLQAKLVFWTLTSAVIMGIGFIGMTKLWPWALIIVPPAFVWFLNRQERSIQAMIAVFLDRVAEDWKFQRLQTKSESE